MSDRERGAVFALVRRGVATELRQYRSLFPWLARRPDVPGGTEAFGYAQLVTPVMWLWIFASAAEVVVVDLLLPWTTVRIIALVIGVWGLLWMVSLLAGFKVHPHLLSDSVLRVRNGASIDITVPWDAIATVTSQRRDLPSSVRTLQPRETDLGTDQQVGVSGEVNVHAVLRRPVSVTTPKGGAEITALSFFADDPRALVARARQHLPPGVNVEQGRRGRGR